MNAPNRNPSTAKQQPQQQRPPAPQAATAAAPAELEKPASPAATLALIKRDVVDVVAAKIGSLLEQGELHLPPNYSAPNALKSAWLAIQEAEDKNGNKALNVCTHDSIANSLLDMVVQGLNPAKKQCYFIVYGKRLICQRSYFGNVALLRRAYGQGSEVWAEVVYEGDEFEYAVEGGNKRVVKHVQKMANVVSGKIVAAYAVVETEGSRKPRTFVMTHAQVVKAWQQGATKGQSPAHINFDADMHKKTVISHACKLLINSSDDSYLVRAIARQAVATQAVMVRENARAALAAGGEIDLPPDPADAEEIPEGAGAEPMREPGEEPEGESAGF